MPCGKKKKEDLQRKSVLDAIQMNNKGLLRNYLDYREFWDKIGEDAKKKKK